MSIALQILFLFPLFLNGAAFDATPDQLLKAAKSSKLDPDKPVILLEENVRMRFDKEGRRELYFHRIYFIRTAEAVEDWDSIGVSFTPWHQVKPTIRARVITSDAKQHTLDQKTLVDSPALEYESDIYSDRRVVNAPLPAVAAGSVVEWEYTLKDTAQFFSAGTIHSWEIGDWTPVEKTSLEIQAPKSLDLKVISRLLPPDTLRKNEVSDSIYWRLEMAPPPVHRNSLPMSPSSHVDRPFVGISTASNWNAVAREYSKVVDEKISGAKLADLGLTLNEKLSREATIDTLLRRIHQQVRYIGIELGDGAIFPRTPEEILTRHYGDCKDKAALLVAALRNAGINAHVALLSAGSGQDVDPELPGLGRFNHAIAYIPGEKPLWIDVTAQDTRLNTLPLGDQGRWALIASNDSQALVKIPVAPMESNWDLYSRDIVMSDDGGGKLIETIRAGGVEESGMRAVYAGEPTKEMRDALKNYAKNTLLAEEAKLIAHPAKHDFSKPFELKWESAASNRFVVERSSGVAAIMPAPLLENLPYWFKTKAAEQEDPKEPETIEWDKRNKERVLPFELNHPFISELHYLITPPPFFKAKSLPRSAVENMGPAKLVRKFTTTPEGRIEARLRFEMPKAELTPNEANELRSKALEFLNGGPILIEFIHKAEESLALGRVKEALDDFKAAVSKEPNRAIHRSRLARGYLQSGLGHLARAEARKATELDPKSPDAFKELAFVLQHDLVGRHFRTGWDRNGAIEAFRKSLELKDAPVTRADLAISYEHDADGYRYSSFSQMDKAITEYSALGEKLKLAGVEQNYAICLMMAGKWEESEAAAKKLPNQAFGKLLQYVARTALDGSAPTIISIQRDFPDAQSRAQMLAGVAASLVQVRRYDLAVELFRAVSRIAPNAAISSRLEALTKSKRVEEIVLDPKDPATPVRAMMQAIFSPKFAFSSIRPLMYDTESFDREMKEASESGLDPDKQMRAPLNGLMNQVRSQGLTAEVMGDLVLGASEFTKTGDDDMGYRFEVKMTGGGAMPKIYVLKKGDVPLLGASSNDISEFRVLIPKLLKDNRLKLAQNWMDWIVQDQELENASDELSIPPVRYLWSGVSEQSRGVDSIKIALASIKGPKKTKNVEEIATLQAALLKAKLPRDKAHLLLALAQRHQEATNWTPLLETARKLVLAAPKSGVAFELLISGLIKNKLLAEATTVAEARLKASAKALKTNVELEDEKALEALANIAMEKKDWKTAVGYYDRLAKQRNFNESIKARALWVRNLAGITEDPPFLMAEDENGKAVASKEVETALARSMHFVIQGKASEARERLVRYLEVTGQDLEKPSVRAVVARIAELLGEQEESSRLWLGVVETKTNDSNFADNIAIQMAKAR